MQDATRVGKIAMWLSQGGEFLDKDTGDAKVLGQKEEGMRDTGGSKEQGCLC